MPTSAMSPDLRSQFDEVDKDLQAGLALPSSWYSDPAIFEIERKQILAKEWLYFGHATSLPAGTGYLARDIGGYPIVVTRDKDGQLHAFLNMCRHRLYPLVKGCDSATTMQCLYHAWTYDMAGNLKGVPRSAEVFEKDGVDFPKEQLGLIPVQLECWGPLLFVNLDLEAESLAARIRPMVEFARPILGEDFDHAGDVSWLDGREFKAVSRRIDEETSQFNWKTYADNANECYHCPTVHPGLHACFDTNKSEMLDMGEDFPGYVLVSRERTPRGVEPDPAMDHYVMHIYPAFYLILGGPGLEGKNGVSYQLNTNYPLSASETFFMNEVLAPEDTPQKEIDAIAAGNLEVGAEDMGVIVGVQRAHDAGNGPAGYLLPESDLQVRRFARRVFDAVSSGV